MLFPREKMQIITSYQGRSSEDGWLVLDFSKVETEGLGKVYVALSDVRRLQEERGRAEDDLKKARELLSMGDE